MDRSDGERVVFSYKPNDTSSGYPVTVTVAPEYDKGGIPKRKPAEKSHVNWTMAATQLLIASWVTRKPQFKEMPSREVYSLISKDLRDMGYMYSSDQCSIKWRSLKSSFLKSKTARANPDKPSTWVHYQAMAEALEEEPYICEKREVQESPAFTNEHIDDSVITHTSPPPNSPPQTFIENDDKKKIKRINTSPTKMKTGRKKSDWMKCFSEMKDEWKTRREERRRMHEERMELGRKKLSIMEELISILKAK